MSTTPETPRKPVADVVITVSPLAPPNVRSLHLTDWPIEDAIWEDGRFIIGFHDGHEEVYHPSWAFIAISKARYVEVALQRSHRFVETPPSVVELLSRLTQQPAPPPPYVWPGTLPPASPWGGAQPPSPEQTASYAYDRVMGRQPDRSSWGAPPPAAHDSARISRLNSDVFDVLCMINGIGPKTAARAIAIAGAERLVQMIGSEDRDDLARVPGIGRSMAGALIDHGQAAAVSLAAQYGIDLVPPRPAEGPSRVTI